jgi:hypothetical protein
MRTRRTSSSRWRAALQGPRLDAKSMQQAPDPDELQDLVAGVLRAMGDKTRVSPPGADRGVDILASPEGFGFEQPRIIVERKHRTRTAIRTGPPTDGLRHPRRCGHRLPG